MPDFKLISADGHLNDPPAAWERVQKEYGDRAPKVVENPPGRKGLCHHFQAPKVGETRSEDAS